MGERMSIWGIGPAVGKRTALYAVVVVAVTLVWPQSFPLASAADPLATALGIGLLAVGIPLYGIAVRAMLRAHRQQKLLTHGVYAVCRHPIYASWILLILPALALLANSWLLLTVAPVMYLLTRRYLPREEACLESQFGQEYALYRQRVNAIFPTLWRR